MFLNSKRPLEHVEEEEKWNKQNGCADWDLYLVSPEHSLPKSGFQQLN
jgi:hypothetical protein